MTSTTIRDIVKSRTHHTDNVKVMYEVVSAARWAYLRAFNAQGGPDLLLTNADENAIAATTLELDLATLTSDTIFGVKQLWLKLPSDSVYTPLIEVDSSHPAFRERDNRVSTDTQTAAGHPVFFDLFNVTKARFAPALPAGSNLRMDYWKLAPDPDTSTNNPLANGDDVAEALHQPIIEKATAQVFAILDDSRVAYYEREAERKIVDAINGLQRKTTQVARTKPFGWKRRRFI